MTEDGPDAEGEAEEAATADRQSPEEDDGSAGTRGLDQDESSESGERDESPTEDSPSDRVTRDRDRRAEESTAGSQLGTEQDPSDGDAVADERAREDQPDEDASTAEPGAAGPDQERSAAKAEDAATQEAAPEEDASEDIPEDVRSYDRFQKMDRAGYDRVNEFLRDRTYITAREWAIARLCADFRTATGVEMTKIGEHLPELVPFMTDTYSPQAVNQARSAFENKVRMAGATFLYGAMSGFFTADELDDLMYEVTEVAKFLLEVEGVELAVEEELAAEDRISSVMREVREASEQLRYDDVECPHCGEAFRPAETD